MARYMTIPGKKEASQLQRTRLFERVAAILLKRILKGGYAVGLRLPTERELATSFDVNRSTVREALKRLESLGVIEIRHGDGVYVKDYMESPSLDLIWAMFYLDDRLDADILMTLLEIRRILVPEMAALAAMRRDVSHVKTLEEVASNHQGVSVLERDMLVHRVIARASANTLYQVLINFFDRFFLEFGHLYFDDEANAARSVRFHREIYEAVRDADPDRARTVMREVLDYAERAISRKLEYFGGTDPGVKIRMGEKDAGTARD
ncbi:MAG TPA: FadR/GntR family transcriptional regulator [Deltaproteobacteria bacterium]|nr:FadR/GntR family transcriptional regulator [Deltaproteobacteria bacterium]